MRAGALRCGGLRPLLAAWLVVGCASAPADHRVVTPLAPGTDLTAFGALRVEILPQVVLARGPAPRIAWEIVHRVHAKAPDRFDAAAGTPGVRTLHPEIRIDRYNPGWPSFGFGRSQIRGTLVLRAANATLATYEVRKVFGSGGWLDWPPTMEDVERGWAETVARLIVHGVGRG